MQQYLWDGRPALIVLRKLAIICGSGFSRDKPPNLLPSSNAPNNINHASALRLFIPRRHRRPTWRYWLAPRHSGAGLSGPITTWPLSWDALEADLQASAEKKMVLPIAVQQTMDRLLERAKRETQHGKPRMNSRLSAAEKPTRIRSFADTPREEGELRRVQTAVASHSI